LLFLTGEAEDFNQLKELSSGNSLERPTRELLSGEELEEISEMPQASALKFMVAITIITDILSSINAIMECTKPGSLTKKLLSSHNILSKAV